MKSIKSRRAAIEKANQHCKKLMDWLPEALKEDESTARKVACIIWYDKISNYVVSEPYVIDIVRSTSCDVLFDQIKVVETLVSEFGYKEKFAKWRMGGRPTR